MRPFYRYFCAYFVGFVEFYRVRALLFVDNPSGNGFWSNIRLMEKIPKNGSGITY
jgi:hypothetical protein